MKPVITLLLLLVACSGPESPTPPESSDPPARSQSSAPARPSAFRWKKPNGESPLDELLIGIHRQDSLEVGAAGRLMMAGEVEVIPAEDAVALETANPVKDGRVKHDDAANERREDAIVLNVMTLESPVAVLVMGSRHNLADNVKRICGGEVEYGRVQVEGHWKAAGE